MARTVHGLPRPLLLLAVSCLLVLLQFSECSRPSPSTPPAGHDDDDRALHHQLLQLGAEANTAPPPTTTEAARRTGADGDDAAPSSSSPWASPARAVLGASIVASSPPALLQASHRALLARAGTRPAVLLLRSKLARRLLAGAGVDEATSGTDGAGTGASCHSYNPHIYCPPAWKP